MSLGRTGGLPNRRTWFGHLIVDFPQSRGHLVGQGTSNNHNIGLSRTCSEDYTETILVVSSGSHVHHLDGAAGETWSEGQGDVRDALGSVYGPKVMGHIELCLAQLAILSMVDSTYSAKRSALRLQLRMAI